MEFVYGNIIVNGTAFDDLSFNSNNVSSVNITKAVMRDAFVLIIGIIEQCNVD